MRKLISFSMLCLMTLSISAVFSCTEKDKGAGGGSESPVSYVDLGLSSGAKWKTANEKNAADSVYDFFTYDEAVAQFGDNLPSREQWMELINECEWSWTGMGYKVTGPNGKYILLPAAGCRDCSGDVRLVEYSGYCWSSTPRVSESAWSLFFAPDYVGMCEYDQCLGTSVRLVQD